MLDSLHISSVVKRHKKGRWVSWGPFDRGKIKLNDVGSCINGKFAGGAAVRNEVCDLILALFFSGHLGSNSFSKTQSLCP